MSVMPAPAPPQPEPPSPKFRWYHKLVGLLWVILCFEIGIFLLAFPWSSYWSSNYFGWLSPEWRQIWLSSWLRGAITGLGVVNLYVSLLEVFRLQRFSADYEEAASTTMKSVTREPE